MLSITSTEVSVRSGRDPVDGSTSIQMEYIITQMVLPSTTSQPPPTDSSVVGTTSAAFQATYWRITNHDSGLNSQGVN